MLKSYVNKEQILKSWRFAINMTTKKAQVDKKNTTHRTPTERFYDMFKGKISEFALYNRLEKSDDWYLEDKPSLWCDPDKVDGGSDLKALDKYGIEHYFQVKSSYYSSSYYPKVWVNKDVKPLVMKTLFVGVRVSPVLDGKVVKRNGQYVAFPHITSFKCPCSIVAVMSGQKFWKVAVHNRLTWAHATSKSWSYNINLFPKNEDFPYRYKSVPMPRTMMVFPYPGSKEKFHHPDTQRGVSMSKAEVLKHIGKLDKAIGKLKE